jgi:hypothetical protein
MPVQSNIAVGTVGTVAWDGTTARPMDIRKHIRFGWSFEVIGAIAVDAVFNIRSAPPSAEDPCVPGAFAAVPEVSICDSPAEPSAQATVTIPAGTPIGTICGGTIPCRPNAFVQLVSASGTTANVLVVGLRQGPTM